MHNMYSYMFIDINIQCLLKAHFLLGKFLASAGDGKKTFIIIALGVKAQTCFCALNVL